MRRSLSTARWLVAAALLAAGSRRAAAQGAARSMDIDPSVIASGMGGASAAMWWSAEPNYWVNPALLGYSHGLRWQWGKTQLVPGLASDITFETKRLTIGAWGVGIESAGRPEGFPGGLRLDYGPSAAAPLRRGARICREAHRRGARSEQPAGHGQRGQP